MKQSKLKKNKCPKCKGENKIQIGWKRPDSAFEDGSLHAVPSYGECDKCVNGLIFENDEPEKLEK